MTAGTPAIDPAAILSALPVAALLLDPDDRFLYANQWAEQFLGLSWPQLAQIGLQDLVGRDSALLHLVEQVRAQQSTVSHHDLTIDGPRLHKQGVVFHGTVLTEASDCVLLTFQDGSAAQALSRQVAFRGAARTVSNMAAMLAHEVKNPLSGIRGAAQLLEGSVGPDDRELAVLIRDESDRIRALVDRMQMFDEKPIERHGVNIHRVLGHVRRLAQSGFAENVKITELYDPSLPPVWGDRDQLVQVLLNLVKNAAEALEGAEYGEIILATAYQPGVRLFVPGSEQRVHLPLVVAVRDNGPGIPDSIRPQLFEPFVTTRVQGSGLGLAMVAKIVGDHGGSIEVDSRPGRTEFRLHLPMLSDDDHTKTHT